MTLLFVCSGNTCRSPMAAALAADYCQKHGLPIQTMSGGLATMAGLPASSGALRAMERRGIDLTSHRSTPVTAELIRQADYLVPMTEGHRARLLQLGSPEEKILRLPQEVSDPYGRNDDVYESCARQLEQLLPNLLEELKGACGT